MSPAGTRSTSSHRVHCLFEAPLPDERIGDAWQGRRERGALADPGRSVTQATEDTARHAEAPLGEEVAGDPGEPREVLDVLIQVRHDHRVGLVELFT